MDADHDLSPPVAVVFHLFQLVIDAVARCRNGLNHAGPGAVWTGLAQGAFQRLPDTLARNGYQAELVELENLVGSLVLGDLLGERFHDPLAVLALVHVDKVDHDDPAQVPQTDLLDDLPDCFQVGTGDRLFQTVPAPHELPGVDVDTYEGFCLVDNDIAAALQPDLGLQQLLGLSRDPIFVEDVGVLCKELHPVHEIRIDFVHKLDNSLVFRLFVHTDRRELKRELIPQKPLHEVQLRMNQRRPRRLFRPSPNVLPKLNQIVQIVGQVLFGVLLRGRPDDDSSAKPVPILKNNVLQAAALRIGRDLAGNSDVIYRRHID